MFSSKKNFAETSSPSRVEFDELCLAVTQLKQSRDNLKKEVSCLRSEGQSLRLRLETTLQFFEIRLDSVYRNIATGNAHTGTSKEVARLLPTNQNWEQLIFASRLPFLSPGKILSPITLSGMRLDTRYATEKLIYAYIKGGVDGIAIFGPYKRLAVGEYALMLIFEADDQNSPVSLEIEVFTVQNGEDKQIANNQITSTSGSKICFNWDRTLEECDVEFRIWQRKGGAIKFFGLDLQLL